MTPALSVVIPVRDQAPRLRLTLAALERQHGIEPDAFEVVVVDDDSSDGVADVIADQAARRVYPLAMVRSRSGGARGVPRNLGIERSRGGVILLLDADALPGRCLIARHLALHDRPGQIVVGDMFVLPDVEALVDPSPVVPVEEDALRARAQKGIYPGHENWHAQLEDAVEHGEPTLTALAVVPHNLSLDRAVVDGVGGFDTALPHFEGWDLGLRAMGAGVAIRLARGARSFHLYHPRNASQVTSNVERARAVLTRRYPDLAVDLLELWMAACAGDPYVPPELGLADWRSLARALADPIARADGERIARLRATLAQPVSSLDVWMQSAFAE